MEVFMLEEWPSGEPDLVDFFTTLDGAKSRYPTLTWTQVHDGRWHTIDELNIEYTISSHPVKEK